MVVNALSLLNAHWFGSPQTVMSLLSTRSIKHGWSTPISQTMNWRMHGHDPCGHHVFCCIAVSPLAPRAQAPADRTGVPPRSAACLEREPFQIAEPSSWMRGGIIGV
jgi:hypothetical protein